MKEKSSVVKITWKSSLFIILCILAATLVLPNILDLLGLKLYPLRVLVIALATGWSISYTLYFRETNRGYTRGFWIVLILISILAGYISYFWVYDIYYL